MKKDFLIEAIGNIDHEIVDEAENYRPKRKSRVWLWTSASAACLLIAGVLVFPHLIEVSNNAGSEGRVHFVSRTNGEYSAYRDPAANGSVHITPDLTRYMEAYANYPDAEFLVHIYDANGAHSEIVWDTCLEALGLRSSQKESFLANGVVALTEAQISAIKSSPQLAVVIDGPGDIEVTEEYLKTVNGPLNVWVFTNSGIDEALVGHEGEERIRFCKKYIDEFFSEYENDHGLNREEFEYFGIYTGTFRAQLDKEKVEELLADNRTADITVWLITVAGYDQYAADF